GDNLKEYYLHYINRGKLEGRDGVETNICNGIDYNSVYNYDYYTSKNPDIKNAFGNDRKATFEHFINRGMLEGRRASAEFDVNYYREQNQDLQNAYGDNLKEYYLHYINRGKLERRIGAE
ncbi:MAG: hypothetical protein Q4F21_03125, partial [Lachnospiraceae bacterium]|nr:hypothetical protein [Lachnospiraceae bacterium]